MPHIHIFMSHNSFFYEPSLGSSLCLSMIVKVASNLTERGICSHGKMSKSAITRDGLFEN